MVLLALLEEKFEADVIDEFEEGKKCWDNRRSKVGLDALNGPALVLALARPLRAARGLGWDWREDEWLASDIEAIDGVRVTVTKPERVKGVPRSEVEGVRRPMSVFAPFGRGGAGMDSWVRLPSGCRRDIVRRRAPVCADSERRSCEVFEPKRLG